jgi:hypothetical protein
MPQPDSPLLHQLSVNSQPYRDPLTHLPWDALSLDDFWLPPAALSLAGVAEFERQPEAIQKRLSQYEFLNFIQAGLWLEGVFIARLTKASPFKSYEEYAYSLHEIREEAGHSLMFLKLIAQSGLDLPSASFRRPWLTDLLGRHAPSESTLFWLAVVIGEEIPDRLNRFARTHGEEINPLITAMCRLHIIDEARHIARARNKLEQRLANTSTLTHTLLSPLVRTLIAQFVRTFYLPRAEVYELSGLRIGHEWQARARKNPARIKFVMHTIRPTLNLLARHGFSVHSPAI